MFFWKTNKPVEHMTNELITNRGLSVKEVAKVVLPLFFLSALLFILLSPVSDSLIEFFYWFGEDKFLDMGLSKSFSTEKLATTYLLFLVFIVFVLPYVEEVYFRGFLFPRMPIKSVSKRVVIHSLLFAIYHTWTPWMIPMRWVGVLPMTYAAWKLRRICAVSPRLTPSCQPI
jgi:membrane protease YdiL (CAAX protease family)